MNTLRCETTYLDGSFMTLGPRDRVQCSRPAIGRTSNIDWDGKSDYGSQLICARCLIVFNKRNPDDKYIFTPIEVILDPEQ